MCLPMAPVPITPTLIRFPFRASETECSSFSIQDGNGLYLNQPFGTDQSLDHHEGTRRWVLGIYKTVPHFQNLWDQGRIDSLHAEVIQLHYIAETASSRIDRGL